jgi:hypothetical protein
VSPPLSATVRRDIVASTLLIYPVPISISSHSRTGEPSLHPQPLVQRATIASITMTGTTGISVTRHTSITDPITDEVGRLSHVGWTGGCDFDFLLEDREPSGDDLRLQPNPWVGSWSSPSH